MSESLPIVLWEIQVPVPLSRHLADSLQSRAGIDFYGLGRNEESTVGHRILRGADPNLAVIAVRRWRSENGFSVELLSSIPEDTSGSYDVELSDLLDTLEGLSAVQGAQRNISVILKADDFDHRNSERADRQRNDLALRRTQALAAFRQAVATDADSEIVAAWTAELITTQLITGAEEERYDLALRRTQALAAFRQAVATDADSDIVAAWTAELITTQLITVAEQQRYELARERLKSVGAWFLEAPPPSSADTEAPKRVDDLEQYTASWSIADPGCMIMLIDQSASMGANLAGTRKAVTVAEMVNRQLEYLIAASTAGQEVRPRVDIAVIGYGGAGIKSALPSPIDVLDFVSPDILRRNPRLIERRRTRSTTDTEDELEEEEYVIEWVAPVNEGGTPMCTALRRAAVLAMGWASAHRASYPPIIINVTDGAATDGSHDELRQAAARLTEIETGDGRALLYNCHISEREGPPIVFPSRVEQIPKDTVARLMYEISSQVPDSSRYRWKVLRGQELGRGARGFVFNASIASVDTFLKAASMAGMERRDP